MRTAATRYLAIPLLAGSLLVAGCSGGGSGDGSSGGSATLSVLGAPVGQAADQKTPTTPVTATFDPASPGASVTIQEQKGGSWKDVATGKQDKSGQYVGEVASGGANHQLRARSTVKGATVTSKAVTAQPMKQAWSDEFDGTSLDTANWQTRVQPAFGRRLCAQPDASRVRVAGGSAVLSVERVGSSSSCPHGVWRNAMIGTGEVTQPGFHGKYGVYAARVKFQHAQGMHGSFWMQGTGPGSAEIDVAEYFGDGRADGGLSNFIHLTGADGSVTSTGGTQPSVARILKRKSPAAGWHVYSVEWSPKGYTFRLDGHTTFRSTKPPVASAKEFLVLSLLTSDYELPRMTNPSAKMKVDWVRVWQ